MSAGEGSAGAGRADCVSDSASDSWWECMCGRIRRLLWRCGMGMGMSEGREDDGAGEQIEYMF
jgi:hypothetical protein